MNKTSPALKAVGLGKSFPKPDGASVQIIKDIDFTLERGAFESVMGPSGSGKSTFLHLLAGLLAPDHGVIEIGGATVSDMNDTQRTLHRRRHIGLIFQDFNLLPTLTAGENAMLPLLLDGRKDMSSVVNIMRLLGIEDLSGRMPGTLSGGERQRVAIARALATSPDVVLADEPTGSLDSPAAHDFCRLLRQINAETGSAVLLITHDPIIAAYSSKVHLLKDGRFEGSFGTESDPAAVSKKYLEAMSFGGDCK